MIQISCYRTTKDQLPKAFCSLAEKCYYSKLRANVFTENEDYSQSLDRVLWTYSKKHFIPHATNLDPAPEKQPIYITHNIKEYNQAEIIIFVNPVQKTILEIFLDSKLMNPKIIQKILFIFDDTQNIQFDEIKNILEKSSIKEYTIKAFSQTKQASWEKIQ